MSEKRTDASVPEAISIVAICFGWAIAASFHAVSAGVATGTGFSDAGFLGVIAIEFISAVTVLTVLATRNYAVRTLFPTPTLTGCGAGLVLYVIACVFGMLLAIPFAHDTAAQPIEKLMAHATVSLPVLVAAAVVNGNFEEIFLLGYLARGLAGRGFAIAVGVSLAVRVTYHFYQGPAGAAFVFGYGLLVGIFYVRTRALFPVIFAHVLGDVAPFLLR